MNKLTKDATRIKTDLLVKKHALLDFEMDKRIISIKINEFLGKLDGGNLSVAQGRVIYPQEQTRRRIEVINVPDSFYR